MRLDAQPEVRRLDLLQFPGSVGKALGVPGYSRGRCLAVHLEMRPRRHINGEVGPAAGAGLWLYLHGRVDAIQQHEGDQLGQRGPDQLVVPVLEPGDKRGPR